MSSVGGPDFVSIALNAIRFLPSLTHGHMPTLVIFVQHRMRARSGTIRDKSIGHEMNSRHFVFYISALGLSVLLAAEPAGAQTRIGEAAVVKNEVVRVRASGTTPINVGDSVVRDETVRTGTDSATRLVMADSTNLSLGPNSTLRLDRTVFDDATSYRDISIKLDIGRIPLRHRQFGQGRLQDPDPGRDHRRTRHHPRHPVPARQDHRGAARQWRLAGLHPQLSMHRTDQARRHCHHHLRRRQVHHPEIQHAALDLRLWRRGGTLQHHSVCRRDADHYTPCR